MRRCSPGRRDPSGRRGTGDALLSIEDGTLVVVDGTTGIVHVAPEPSLLAELTAERDERETAVHEARASAREPARTVDGFIVEVAANIGAPADAVRAVAAGADGIGLFRTEFLFMGRSSMPDARERKRRIEKRRKHWAIARWWIRTLDVGADKPLAYLDQPSEPNPFLGVRDPAGARASPTSCGRSSARSCAWPPTIRFGSCSR